MTNVYQCPNCDFVMSECAYLSLLVPVLCRCGTSITRFIHRKDFFNAQTERDLPEPVRPAPGDL